MNTMPVRGGPVPLQTVLNFESLLAEQPQVELPVTNHFSKGVYGRELFIPKGTTLVGKIHKYQNLNVLLKGDISVSTDTGVQRVQAPFIVSSPPGTKRVAYAHEDCIWLTIHGTEETDVDLIEEQFTAESPADYLSFVEALQLEGV
jgi:hypothetical protein